MIEDSTNNATIKATLILFAPLLSALALLAGCALSPQKTSFQRATPEEHAEASRKLEMRAKLNKGAY